MRALVVLFVVAMLVMTAFIVAQPVVTWQSCSTASNTGWAAITIMLALIGTLIGVIVWYD